MIPQLHLLLWVFAYDEPTERGFQRRQMCSHAIVQKSASLVCAQVEF